MPRFIAIFSSNPPHTLAIAQTLTPRIEIHPPDGLLLEVTARVEDSILNKLLHQTSEANQLKTGIASSRIAALFAAQSRPGAVVAPGTERDFLASLPVRLISLTPYGYDHKLFLTLFRWGIRTLGELAVLPEQELVERLGQTGLCLQRIAQGQDVDLFQCHVEEPHFKESQELEWTLDSLEPLAFILGGMLECLCQRLQNRGLAVESLQTVLQLENCTSYKRTLRVALPMQDPKVLLSLLRLDLQSHPPDSGVVGVSIQASPAPPQITQHSLLHPPRPNPEKLARTLGRLTALVGETNIGSPVLLDTYRPDAITMEPLQAKEQEQKSFIRHLPLPARNFLRLSLRRFRPPVATRLRSEQIAACAGPWRSCGNWWKDPSLQWSRDEWDVELLDGPIYRVYWDFHKKTWFLEGIYD